MHTETTYAIALSYLSGVGPVRARKLLALAGSYEACFGLSDAEYRQLKLPATTRQQLKERGVLTAAEREMRFVEQHGIRVVDCLHEDYPQRLAELPDAPLVLYQRGNASLAPRRAVAIVGTRKITAQGRATCERLVEELSAYGVTVLSGLAYGVDIVAHRASLRHGAPTVGVLAHGLGEIYPAAHRATAAEMLHEGALVTEYPSGMRSRREFFPQRNRVIAGMSDAVIVIESGATGGSMITAKLAGDYYRALFAVPGRVTDPMSRGCNELIKTQRANLIESARDVAFHLGWGGRGADSQEAGFGVAAELPLQSFSPIEKSVVDLLKLEVELDIDTISHRSSLDSGQLAGALLELEFRGVVRALPGKRYTLS